MPPAARVSDICSLASVALPAAPITGGEGTVLIAYQPAARVGDTVVSDVIAAGEPTVMIGDMPAARIGDPTATGGTVMMGCPTVNIGSSNQVEALRTDKPFCEQCERKRREGEQA